METSTWRLIRSTTARGSFNMALDEALLELVGEKKSFPILRLYAWEPPCLSLGYAQPFSDVNSLTLEDQGWDVVRRPTGGRAILHTDELTYAVIAHKDEPRLAGGILESYQRISKALLLALNWLGLNPRADKEYPRQPGALPNAPVCFEVPSNYEITVNEKKLIGSAQARRKDGVLQHGSLPLYGDLTRITRALHFTSEEKRQQAAERLLNHATTVEMILNKRISWKEAANAFEQAFQQALDIHFEISQPTHPELRRANQLVQEKYANPNWLERL
jgi:lipoyl(octanoyl) transferase